MLPFIHTPFSVKLLTLAVMAATLGVTTLPAMADNDEDELLAFVSVASPATKPVVTPVARTAVNNTAVLPARAQAPAPVSRTLPVPSGGMLTGPRSAPAEVNTPAQTASVPPAPSASEGRRFLTRTAPISVATGTPVSRPVPAPAVSAQKTVVSAAAAQAPAPNGGFFRPVTSSGASQAQTSSVTRTTQPHVATVSRPQFVQPALTPLPAVPAQVAAPRRQISGAPGEAEIKSLFANAVRQAIRISPRISSSRYQSEAARGSVDEAKGQRWPQVDVTSNSKSLFFGGGARNGGSKSDVPAVGINMATTLYDFGQNSNTIKTREDQARAAEVGIAAEEETTAWDLSNALIELSKQRLIIQLSQDYVTRMKELTNMLSGIVAVDQGRRSELTQAKGRLLSAQSSLDAAVSKARDTEIVLYRMLGDSQVALPPAAQWNLSLPVMTSQLAMLERHPTILKAQAEAKASLSEAAAVRSSGLPKLNWVVSKNTGEDELGRTQAFQTGLQVSWGLFRGGSNSAAERAALARAEASRHLVDEQMRDLEQRVRGANQDAGSLLERADLYQNLKTESDRIRLAFFEQWYHLGKRTLLDVLSAESDYYNNRVNEVSSRFEGYAAIMRSYASSGQLISWLNNQHR